MSASAPSAPLTEPAPNRKTLACKKYKAKVLETAQALVEDIPPNHQTFQEGPRNSFVVRAMRNAETFIQHLQNELAKIKTEQADLKYNFKELHAVLLHQNRVAFRQSNQIHILSGIIETYQEAAAGETAAEALGIENTGPSTEQKVKKLIQDYMARGPLITGKKRKRSDEIGAHPADLLERKRMDSARDASRSGSEESLTETERLSEVSSTNYDDVDDKDDDNDEEEEKEEEKEEDDDEDDQ